MSSLGRSLERTSSPRCVSHVVVLCKSSCSVFIVDWLRVFALSIEHDQKLHSLSFSYTSSSSESKSAAQGEDASMPSKAFSGKSHRKNSSSLHGENIDGKCSGRSAIDFPEYRRERARKWRRKQLFESIVTEDPAPTGTAHSVLCWLSVGIESYSIMLCSISPSEKKFSSHGENGLADSSCSDRSAIGFQSIGANVLGSDCSVDCDRGLGSDTCTRTR